MDYRSDEAKHINGLFMNARLANIYEEIDGKQTIVGYKHRTMDMMYLRTTTDRLVRVDGPASDFQYNQLSKDKQRFEPMDGAFVRGETIDRARPFLRSELIPPQTMYEFGRDVVMPKAIWLVAGAALAASIKPALHYIAAHSAHAGVAGAVGVHQAAAFGAYVDAHENAEAHDHTDASEHTEHPTDAEHAADHTHHDVPGSAEHPVEAPNGCVFDGTPESAGEAMLPGACKTKVTWMALDVHEGDDDWQDVSEKHYNHTPFKDLSDPSVWRELNAKDYAMLGVCGAAASVAAVGVTSQVIVPEMRMFAEDLSDRLSELRGEDPPARQRPIGPSIFH